MKLKARKGTVTFEEFCDRVREDQKADLIDGVIYMPSPENTDSNDLFISLVRLISDFIEYYDLGKIFGSRVACRLDDYNGPEPDILFIPKDQLYRIERGHIAGPAAAALEIVSPESVERDYVRKKHLYEEFGFEEYWIIDEELRRITLYRRGARGKFREIKPHKGECHSEVLTGFWLRPEWLFRSPRSRKADVLQQILARSSRERQS